MKTDIVIAGVGGQGILSIAAALGTAALENNYHMKQAETHGMSQRGGAVQAYMRISDKPVYSDLIPLNAADLILSVEPMEALRYLPYLSENGYLVTNSIPYKNIPNYPDVDTIYETINQLPKCIIIDADSIAAGIQSKRSSNMVMLGAASPFIHIDYQNLEDGIRNIFKQKGKNVVDINLKALQAGREFTEKNMS